MSGENIKSKEKTREKGKERMKKIILILKRNSEKRKMKNA